MRINVLTVMLAMFVMVAAATPAQAQDQSDEWQFQIAPLYLWAISLDGTMDIRGRIEQDFTVDFKDAFDNLEGAFTVHFEQSGDIESRSLLDLHLSDEDVLEGVDTLASLLDGEGDGFGESGPMLYHTHNEL